MGFKLYLFIAQCIILCIQYKLTHAELTRNAREGEFPFVVSIKTIDNLNFEPERDHVCAGILISNRDVLTVEHCFDELEISGIEVIVGSVNIRSGIRHHPVWWVSFEQWASIRNYPITFQKNEISILRLSHPVSPAIDPVQFANSERPTVYASNAVTAGWGELTLGIIPRTMRTAILYPIPNEECQQKSYRVYGEISYQVRDNVICTTGDQVGDWHLIDFGGPLLFNGELIGVNQEVHPFPSDPPNQEKFNVHIRIDYYMDYINDVRRQF